MRYLKNLRKFIEEEEEPIGLLNWLDEELENDEIDLEEWGFWKGELEEE